MSFNTEADPQLGRFTVALLRQFVSTFPPQGWQVSLICFTHKPGFTAFATTYPSKAQLIEIIDLRVKRWKNKPAPMVLSDTDKLPHPDMVDVYGKWFAAALRDTGKGFAVFVGEGERTQYFSSAERAGAIELFQELLPKLRADLQ